MTRSWNGGRLFVGTCGGFGVRCTFITFPGQSAGVVSLAHDIARLRTSNPQRYGVLEQNYVVVSEAIRACDRAYPNTNQLYMLVEGEDVSLRLFGNTLSLLASLDVVAVYTERNRVNRYDLTVSYEESLTALERLLERESQ